MHLPKKKGSGPDLRSESRVLRITMPGPDHIDKRC